MDVESRRSSVCLFCSILNQPDEAKETLNQLDQYPHFHACNIWNPASASVRAFPLSFLPSPLSKQQSSPPSDQESNPGYDFSAGTLSRAPQAACLSEAAGPGYSAPPSLPAWDRRGFAVGEDQCGSRKAGFAQILGRRLLSRWI